MKKISKNHIFRIISLFFQSVCVGIVWSMLLCSYAYAGPSYDSITHTITQAITDSGSQLWTIQVSIVGPIAAVSLALCGIKILFGNQHDAEVAQKTAIRICFGIFLVLLAPSLISMVKGSFNGGGWSWIF